MSDEVIVSVLTRGFGGLTFDAVLVEDHSSDLEITDNPVETGVSVTDHSYLKPKVVKLTVGVTNTPLRVRADDKFSDVGENRVRRAFELLLDLQAKREPFDVVTGLKLYNNMVVKSLATRQEGPKDNAAAFDVTLREILIVTTQIVTYPPRKSGATHQQASRKSDSGEKQGKDPEKQKRSSIAKSLEKLLSSGN